jgi:peptidoglycan hydrolase CwlO-like protein
MESHIGVIVSIFMGILSLFSGFMFFQLRAIDKKQEAICARIQEEKKDREKSVEERRSDIKEIFGKVEHVSETVGRLEEKVLSQQLLCNERHA